MGSYGVSCIRSPLAWYVWGMSGSLLAAIVRDRFAGVLLVSSISVERSAPLSSINPKARLVRLIVSNLDNIINKRILLRLARAHAILRKFLVYVAEQPQVDRRFGRHPMPGAARPWFERAVTGGKEEIAVYDDSPQTRIP